MATLRVNGAILDALRSGFRDGCKSCEKQRCDSRFQYHCRHFLADARCESAVVIEAAGCPRAVAPRRDLRQRRRSVVLQSMESDPFQPLETTRLLLRCVATEDATATAMMMTPEVSRWVAYWPIPFSYEMAVAHIEVACERARRGDALPFAVIEKASGELTGWVMISRDEEHPRRGSLGYWLGEKHHGKGYMRELAPVALAAGFDLLDLDVIEAGVQPGNAPSIAVLRACGMKPTGEGLVYAPARERYELCHFYEVHRPHSLKVRHPFS